MDNILPRGRHVEFDLDDYLGVTDMAEIMNEPSASERENEAMS